MLSANEMQDTELQIQENMSNFFKTNRPIDVCYPIRLTMKAST